MAIKVVEMVDLVGLVDLKDSLELVDTNVFTYLTVQ